jgi:hypothetical protein
MRRIEAEWHFLDHVSAPKGRTLVWPMPGSPDFGLDLLVSEQRLAASSGAVKKQ